MKYFIDFEATQFTQEIISIGCIREDGEKFYSLIKPKNLKTITKFITELTGISKKDLVNEKNSDEVFENFFDWLNTDLNPVEFYCYGNSDLDFLKKNLKSRTFNFKAQAALSIIAMNLNDYSTRVKNYFGLIKNISLKKVFDYFYPEEEYRWHNALSDAEMLYKIFIEVESGKRVEGIPFPDYIEIPIFKESKDFFMYQIEKIDALKSTKIYNSLEEASEDLINFIKQQGNKEKISQKNIEKRIIKAINNKTKYFNQKWIVRVKKGEYNGAK